MKREAESEKTRGRRLHSNVPMRTALAYHSAWKPNAELRGSVNNDLIRSTRPAAAIPNGVMTELRRSASAAIEIAAAAVCEEAAEGPALILAAPRRAITRFITDDDPAAAIRALTARAGL